MVALPLVVGGIGAVKFGWWAVLTTPTSLAGLFDLAVVPAVVALAGSSLADARSMSSSTDAESSLRQAASFGIAGLFLTTFLAIGALLLGWFAAPSLVRLIGTPADMTGTAMLLMRCAVVNLAATIVGNGVVASTEAVGRVDLTAVGAGILSAMNSLMMIGAIAVAPSLRTLAYVVVMNAALTLVVYGVCGIVAGLPRLFSWGALNQVSVKAVAKVGVHLGAAGALGALTEPAVKWTAQILVGPSAVAVYEIAQRIVGMVLGGVRSMLYPLMARLANVNSQNSRLEFADTIIAGERAVLSLAVPATAAVAVGIGPVYELWLRGSVPSGASGAATVLLVGGIVSLIATPAYHALQSRADGRLLVIAQAVGLMAALAVVVLSSALGWTLLAAALGYACGAAVGGAITVLGSGEGRGFVDGRLSHALGQGLLASTLILGVGAASRLAGVSPGLSVCLIGFATTALLFFMRESRVQLGIVARAVIRR